MELKLRLTRGRVAMLVVLAGSITVGAAYATIPDSGGVIHGCYNAAPARNSGQLRVIDPSAGGACSASENSLDWNATGPKGDPGMSGYQVVFNRDSLTATEANTTKASSAQVTCPAGKRAVGGGGGGDTTINDVNQGPGHLTFSAPTSGLDGSSGWAAGVGKADGSYLAVGETIHITAWAVCVNVAN